MIIKYHGEAFKLRLLEATDLGIKGFLQLDEQQAEKMDSLADLEDEFWYLDEHGERLDSDALFAASPFSIDTPNGEVKLLLRFHNMETGEIRFNTQDGYGGELFKWIRSQ